MTHQAHNLCHFLFFIVATFDQLKVLLVHAGIFQEKNCQTGVSLSYEYESCSQQLGINCLVDRLFII